MRFENFERSTQIIGGALRVPRILDKQINQLLKAQTCTRPQVYILYGNYLISGDHMIPTKLCKIFKFGGYIF